MLWQEIPDGLDIQEGQTGTIQIVTSGDLDGGLYSVCTLTASVEIFIWMTERTAGYSNDLHVLQCADITFSSAASAGPCTNGSGVTATGYSGLHTNANETEGSTSTSSPIGDVSSPPQPNGAMKKAELGSGILLLASTMVSML